MLTVLDNVEDETEPVPKRSKQEVMSSICAICGLADREILKGSSVPKPFLVDLLEHLGGGRNERITKHAAFTKALSLLDPENGATRSEKHLSRAGTVALSGLIALEGALISLPVEP